jgi:predicted RNA-binding protein YlxR (DUF448 family)
VAHSNERWRTCIGCRTRNTAAELVRFKVLCGKLVVEGRKMLPGRGAWLCPDSKCLDRALRSRGFSRALRQDVMVPDRESLWAGICERLASSRQGRPGTVTAGGGDGGA